VARQVVPLPEVEGLVRRWAADHGVDVVLVGDQTGAKQVLNRLSGLPVPVMPVKERGTTLLARRRYFRDHPPRGWRRLLPLSFQVPPEPYDDYAAVVIAETYLAPSPTIQNALRVNTSSGGIHPKFPRKILDTCRNMTVIYTAIASERHPRTYSFCSY